MMQVAGRAVTRSAQRAGEVHLHSVCVLVTLYIPLNTEFFCYQNVSSADIFLYNGVKCSIVKFMCMAHHECYF